MGMTTLCQQVFRPVKGLKIVLVLVVVLVLEKGGFSRRRALNYG
jgi:hypothetical protein